MVEKRARRAFDIFDVPFAILAPELAMSTADDLALEPDGRRRGLVAVQVGHGLAIAFRVSPDSNDFVSIWQRSRNRAKS